MFPIGNTAAALFVEDFFADAIKGHGEFLSSRQRIMFKSSYR